MRLLNDQAQLFVVAAALLALGFWLLYLALGFYGVAITKIIRHLGLFGAIVAFSREKRNNKRWWIREAALIARRAMNGGQPN